MARLFTLYPTGALGAGLLFLRASAAVFVLHAALDHQLRSPALLIGAAAIAFILGIGFLTRICATAGAMAMVVLGVAIRGAPITLLIGECLMLIAIALLGPGGYSIDGMLFGRRTIHVPH